MSVFAKITDSHALPQQQDVAHYTGEHSTGMDTMDTGSLRYRDTPFQYRSDKGGITAAENQAVMKLTSGQVNLHGMGTSLKQTHASDARLQRVQARSVAQGKNALVSDTSDRGHELWHLAQQAQNRVPADGNIGGQAVNSNPALEREADRMGALINRHSFIPDMTLPHAPLHSAPQFSAEGPVQRKVQDFKAKTKGYLPPVSDLIDTIDPSYFVQSQATINSAIRNHLNDAKVSTTDVPTNIKAKIRNGGTSLARKTHKSSVVGKNGEDEFALRSGDTREVFEGGHLIPHELWSTSDKDKDDADDYVNLVPMSRSLNVSEAEGSWRNIEKEILDTVASLTSNKQLEVEIDIDHQVWSMSYERIAQLFGFNLTFGKNGSDEVDLYNWLPSKISAQGKTTALGQFSFGEAFENPLHDTSSTISTKAELLEALQATPIWDRMDSALRDKLTNL